MEYVIIEADNKGLPFFFNFSYFGIKTCGGFGHSTEYEIGVGIIFEATHCIFGSIQRAVNSRNGLKSERTHIKEEKGIIVKALKEYSRDLYFDRLFDGYYKSMYVTKTRESLIENAKANLDKLQSILKATNVHSLSSIDKEDAWWSDVVYSGCKFLMTFCLELIRINLGSSIYNSSKIHKAFYAFSEDIDKMLEASK